MDFETLIFDLDGTIWDSWPFYSELFYSACGREYSKTLTYLCKGGNLVKLISSTHGINKRCFVLLCKERGNQINIYPNVRETLTKALRKGVRLGVATSLPGWICEPLLVASGLHSFFDTVVHAGNCHARKPSRNVLITVLNNLNVKAHTAGYIGDSPIDLKTAYNAGIHFTWASYGYGKIDPNIADRVITKFSEVLMA